MSEQKLSSEDVNRVAKLAKLSLTPEQHERFLNQLSEIMEYMDLLNEVDTETIEPTAQVTGLENITREDKPQASLPQEVVLKLAPEVEDGYIKVRNVFTVKEES